MTARTNTGFSSRSSGSGFSSSWPCEAERCTEPGVGRWMARASERGAAGEVKNKFKKKKGWSIRESRKDERVTTALQATVELKENNEHCARITGISVNTSS